MQRKHRTSPSSKSIIFRSVINSNLVKWHQGGDQILVASISMTTPCGGNIGPPLLQSILFIKYINTHFNRILKKGRSYVSSARGRHWDGGHQYSVFPCCHFTSFEIITARALNSSLPLLLFHFIWNHNSKGKVSPPLRPIGFVDISHFL